MRLLEKEKSIKMQAEAVFHEEIARLFDLYGKIYFKSRARKAKSALTGYQLLICIPFPSYFPYSDYAIKRWGGYVRWNRTHDRPVWHVTSRKALRFLLDIVEWLDWTKEPVIQAISWQKSMGLPYFERASSRELLFRDTLMYRMGDKYACWVSPPQPKEA